MINVPPGIRCWLTVIVPVILLGCLTSRLAAQPGIVPPPAKLAPLLEQLEDPDANIRLQAVTGLAAIRGVEACDALVKAVWDPDSRVREAAIIALPNFRYPSANRALIAVLDDPVPSVRAAAARTLGWHQNKQAIDPLLAKRDDTVPAVRAAITEALGKIDDPVVLNALLAAVQDADPTVRTAAARALGNVSDLYQWASVSPSLIMFPNQENTTVVEARKTLRWEEIMAALHALRTDPDATVCAMATIALYRFTAPAGARDLAPLLTYPEVTVRYEAIRALLWRTRPNKDDTPALAAACLAALPEEIDRKVFGELARFLGENKYKPAVPVLITLLDKPDPAFRSSIVLALGSIGDAQAFEPLLPLLEDENNLVRSRAINTLGVLRDARAVEPLLRAVQDPTATIRLYAIRALGNIGDVRAVGPALTLLHDPEEAVRCTAIDALDELHAPRAVEPLLPCLRDPSDIVRQAAIRTLGNTTDPRALEALLAHKETRGQTYCTLLRALGNFQDVRVCMLMRAALLDADNSIRQTANFWLSEVVYRGETDLVEPLLKDDEIAVRRAVFSALKSRGINDRSRPLFLLMLLDRDPGLRGEMATFLGERQDALSAPSLQMLAQNDPDPQVRAAAKVALDNMRTGE